MNSNLKGIRLDLGCGGTKQKGFLGMDKRKLKGVDIVHDLEEFPYPLDNESCRTIVAAHVVEHIKPWKMIDFMNELWRIMEVDGQLAIAYPYGVNLHFQKDPTHCLIDGTEVLTETGFKKIQDIKVGENILTLNLENNKTEYSKCSNIIYEDYDGDILSFKHERMNLEVTPNHDLIYKSRHKNSIFNKFPAETLEKFIEHSKVGIGTINDWKGEELQGKDDFIELLGWIISEGCFVKKKNYQRIHIAQSKVANPIKRERIKNLVQRMGIFKSESENYITIQSDEIFNELSILGKSKDRFIPLKYKNVSVRQLFILLDSLIEGDGSKLPGGEGYSYCTISEKLANDILEIATKCGLRARYTIRPESTFINKKGKGKKYTRKIRYRISICPDRPIIYPKPLRRKYQGKIVCLTVEENHTLLSKHNGNIIWVGNCNVCNQATWTYFDPGYNLYDIYKPLPWKIENNLWQETGQGEVLLKKISIKDGKLRRKEAKHSDKLQIKGRIAAEKKIEKERKKARRVDNFIKNSVEQSLASVDEKELKSGIINNREKPIHRLIYGCPMTGIVRGEWAISRFNQVVPCNWSKVDMTQWLDQWSPLGFTVADARNIIATVAVEQEFEWLFFHDHDVIIPQGTLLWLNELMIKRDTPVVSGIYFTKSVPSEPLIYMRKGEGYAQDWKFGDKKWVGFTHMGCTLIHVSILKAMYAESPSYQMGNSIVKRIFETPAKVWYDYNTDAFHAMAGTEDIHWCDRVVTGGFFEKAG